MFGIEIRRTGSVTNLYSDVDTVLKKAGVNGIEISAQVQTAAIAHSLQKMLNGTHFSVCTITDCAKLVGLRVPAERMNIYNSQHCVNWNEMLPDFRQVLTAMILDDFREVLNPAKEVVHG